MATRIFTSDPKLLWSKQSTSAWLFHPITKGIPAAGVTEVRKRVITAFGNSGNCQLKLGYQIANYDDEDAYGTAVAISAAWLSTNTTSFGSNWSDISSGLTQRLFRLGYMVINGSGTVVETMYAESIIDVRVD